MWNCQMCCVAFLGLIRFQHDWTDMQVTTLQSTRNKESGESLKFRINIKSTKYWGQRSKHPNNRRKHSGGFLYLSLQQFVALYVFCVFYSHYKLKVATARSITSYTQPHPHPPPHTHTHTHTPAYLGSVVSAKTRVRKRLCGCRGLIYLQQQPEGEGALPK